METAYPEPDDRHAPAIESPAADSKTPMIVGIGASAGGLEAIEQFLQHVPVVNGLAFVIVQHLAATHSTPITALLQRITPMLVVEAESGMKIEADHVYVIPPNKDMSILHGTLQLLDPVTNRGMRLPIDYFFRALADDQCERAIGVILSGMGADGSMGLRAIREKGGLALVQDPDTAKFDSMPRTAMTAGLVDIIAPAAELSTRLFTYLQHRPVFPRSERLIESKSQSALQQIVLLLRERTGNDFSMYKKSSMYRRIERRMGLHQINDITHYVRYLRENPQELDLLFKELLIGVTSFFRDKPVWECLKQEILPALLSKQQSDKCLRAWVPGCSTGEEAYSLAITFREAMQEIQPMAPFSLQIFATDLDPDAIEYARQGFYPDNITADVSTERLSKFFVAEGTGYRISNEIREKVIFAPQNIIMDPPFTRLDIILCRNLLIYLGSELQQKLFPLFHYALNSNGILMLGSAETISATSSSLFTPLSNKCRIYQRVDGANEGEHASMKYFPVASVAAQERNLPGKIGDLQMLADQYLLQHFSPAAVLVNADGDILYISGRTGKYLEPAAGKANWNIHAMAREELRHELTFALKKAQRQRDPIKFSGIKIGDATMTMTIQAIEKPSNLKDLIIIVFQPMESSSPGHSSNSLSPGQKSLLEELQQAQEDLHSTREQMQSSQEEFKSTYEELQAINAALQTANEELMTSKEEMQSVNEELKIVNRELESKMEDLSWINNDLNNLIHSTETLAIFLDNALHIRRFTPHATQLFKLIPGDIGRPLTDIVTVLAYPTLQQDAQKVLWSLVFEEKEIPAADGSWFRVRITPYRTEDNVIDGVLITFNDITDYRPSSGRKRKPAAKRQTRNSQ